MKFVIYEHLRTGLEELLLVQTLRVNYSPPRLDDGMPETAAALADSPLQLECLVERGVPTPEVTWKYRPRGGAERELKGRSMNPALWSGRETLRSFLVAAAVAPATLVEADSS